MQQCVYLTRHSVRHVRYFPAHYNAGITEGSHDSYCTRAARKVTLTMRIVGRRISYVCMCSFFLEKLFEVAGELTTKEARTT